MMRCTLVSCKLQIFNKVRKLAGRNAQGKLGAGARLAAYPAIAHMGVGDCSYEAQTEAQATLGAALVAPVQPLPNPRQVLGGNADAGVPHANDNLARGPFDGDLDPAASEGCT